MKKNSRLGVGARINLFDKSESMVYDFNNLFPECPIPERFSNEETVIIGQVLPNNCRELWIDGMNYSHKMFSDMIYNKDRDLYNLDERELELEEIHGHPV